MLSHSHRNYERQGYEEPQNNINDDNAINEEDALSEDGIM